MTEIERDELLKHDFAGIDSIEPFWKLIISNKAVLPLLWSMYPNHPNLLPAYYDAPDYVARGSIKKDYEHWVSKPLFGREGMGVFFSKNFSSFDQF